MRGESARSRLWDADLTSDLEALRQETLRLLLLLSVVAYLAWNAVSSLLAWPTDGVRYLLLFFVVVAGLAGTYLLVRARPWLAASFFLLSSTVSVTSAIWLLVTPLPTVLYPAIALVAVVLLGPVAGVILSTGSLALVVILWRAGPLALLSADRLLEIALGSLFAVVCAWALGRNLVIAAGWALDSYHRAMRAAEEARDHRAQLVQALQQLDSAYYRLQQANAALEVAWRAAETAERSKSEFVTSISHELRTPLNLIVGYTDMMLSSPESYGAHMPTTYRVDLNTVHRSARHLLGLTDDIIDLAKVGIERLALTPEPVDLAGVIAEACDLLRDYVAAKGLSLRTEVAPDLPLLHVDRLRIRQVLLNLLTNAVRFTNQGGVAVAASLSQSGDTVLVRVADTGHGIAAQEIARVFDEYYHSDEGRTASSQFGGIGLGLPISRRLVELHSGQMGVESQVGVGTTFWFSLPVQLAIGAGSHLPYRPVRLPAGAGARERVLVLATEDDRLARFFERHVRGFRVIAAPDLAAASTLAVQLHAVGIIADAAPGVSPEVALPAPMLRFPFPSGTHLAATLGAQGYLVKPVTRVDLQRAIDRLGRAVGSVLVVDDDREFVSLMARMLDAMAASPTYSVSGAGCGEEALELLERRRPDLVLLDLGLPDIPGREVLARMRESREFRNVSVIVVSARDEVEEQFPITGHLGLETPGGISPEELLATVEAVFGTLQSRVAPALTGEATGSAPRGAPPG